MEAAGESRERIASVVRNYNKNKESKKVTPPADAPVVIEDTASDSLDTSSESQETAEVQPHISFEQLNDYSWMDNTSDKAYDIFKAATADKEDAMIKNLEKHYKDEPFEFEVENKSFSRNDIIVVKDQNGRKHKIDTGNELFKEDPDKYLERFRGFVDQSRKDSEVDKLTNKEVDDITKGLVKDSSQVATEKEDTKIKSLKKVIENEVGPSKKKADAESELEVYKDEKRSQEFDQSGIKEKQLADEYNAKLNNLLEQGLKGVQKGTKEYSEKFKKIKDQYDIGFGKGNVDIVNNYQGNYEDRQALAEGKTNKVLRKNIKGGYTTVYSDANVGKKIHTKEQIYAQAINNLKKSLPNGYGLGFVGEETENVFDWLDPKDEWKLLDGMSFEKIEELAGMRLNGDDSIDKTIFNDEMKKAQVDAVQLKLFKQEGRDASIKIKELEDELNVVKTEKTALDQTRVELDKNAEAWKTGGLIDLENLSKEIDELSQPTTQEEFDFYQNKVNQYNKLREQGLKIQGETNAYNKSLNTYNNKVQVINKEFEGAEAMRVDAINKYGYKIVDEMLVDNSNNFKNLKNYESWRKEHKIEYNFADPDAWAVLGQGLINTAAKYYTGTSLWALNGLDAATGGAFSQGEDRYTRLDQLNSMYEKYTNYDYFGKATEEDYNKGEMNALDKGALAIAEGLPFMLAIAASSGKSGFKPNMFTKTVGKKLLDPNFANKIRMAQTAFNITAMDNVLEGKSMGLNDKQAFAYGGVMGTITGMTQMIMPDAEFFKGGVVNEVVKNGLGSTLKRFTTTQGMAFAGKRWTENVLKEIVEEEAEMVLGDVAKASFGLSHSLESMELKNHLKLIHDTAWLSGGMGAVGAKADLKNVRQSVNNQLKGDITEHMKTIDYMSLEMNKKLEEAKANGDKEAEKAYEFELGRLKDAGEYAKNFKAAINVAPENVTDEDLTLLTEKIRLENLKKNQDPAFHAAIDLQLQNINEKIQESSVQRSAIETNKKLFNQTVKNIKVIAGQEGSNVKEFKNDNDKTSKENIDEYINSKNDDGNYIFDEGTRDQVLNNDFYGSYVTDKKGNKILLINEEASEVGEGVNVAAHEFLHQMLETTFASRDASGNIVRDQDGNIKVDKKKAIGIGMELGKWVSEVQGQDFINSQMNKRLQRAYGGADANVQMQEVLTTLSDAIVSGDMVFEETAFDKLGGSLRRTFQKLGMDVKFNTGKDVFNFIKDYNKTVSQGKKLSKAQKKVMTQGAQVGGAVAKAISGEQVAEIQQAENLNKKKQLLVANNIDPDSELGKTFLMSKSSDVAGLLNRFDGNKRQMIQETIGKTKDGKDVFEIRKSNGDYIDNPLVASEFGQEIAPITETIAKRLFDPIPINLRNGVTRGEFINELTVIASSLVEREFDPSKQNIDKFISNRLNLRANKLASDLGIESTVEEGGLGAAIGLEAAAELTAEESAPTTVDTKQIILSDRLGVKSKIDKAIKEKLPSLNVEKLNFKNLKDQAPDVTGEMFGISPKKLISGANITKGELQSAQMFINKNADVLIAMLPEGATASGTATGVPQTLLKAFYSKANRAKMAKTGSKAGLAIQQKNKINKTDFLSTFGIIDGKPIRTDRNTSARVLALANQTGKVMSNQAVREQLSKNTTEENAKLMLKLSDGKSAVMFSKEAAVKNNMPDISDYFKGKTEADVASILDQHANLTDEQFKKAFPKEHDKVKDYIEAVAEFFADGGKEAMQFTKEMKLTNFGNKALNNYLKTGYWTLSDAKFKEDKKAIAWFKGNAHNLADQIFLPENATDGNIRIIMGFFAGHYNVVGSDMAKVGSTLKQGILNRINKKGKSVLSQETINRWQNFDFKSLKSSYASGFYTGLKKIYSTEGEAQQKKLAKEYFTGKEGATQKEFYDLWNTTLEEWLHSSEVGSKEFNSKADYILKLKKANAAIGTTGERIMAPGGYVYLPGSIMSGKIKFEHLKSSSQQSKESALLIINNKFKEFGDLATEKYTGIYGPLELFNAIDETTGRVNSSDIFRLAGNLEAAKNIYSVDNLNKSLYDEIVSTIGKEKIKFLEKTQDQRPVRLIEKAVLMSRSSNNIPRGISVLDFDDTLATSNSKVISTAPDGSVITLTAEQFAAQGADLLQQGYKHDFSEFNKVVDGKVASLFNKALKLQGKFGNDNMFVLTARPAESAESIYQFLKANGLNIPLENITGLANSTPEAKALWISDKVGEGYNDFYFADDALQNVQAVKNMLDQFDVKSKVQQARVNFSKDANQTFNNILESTTGVESIKIFSNAQAKVRGQKTKYKSIIPASAQDFGGLLYNFLGKGKQGEKDMAFFKQALIDPFARGIDELNASRQSAANDFENLNKKFPKIKKQLNKNVQGLNYTNDQAIRVYLWNKAGFEIPGLSQKDLNGLDSMVKNNPELQAYADAVGLISKKEAGYSEPSNYWLAESVASDLLSDGSIGDVRSKFLQEWKENVDTIFSPDNLNKIEAIYGSKFREALQDVLYRMETGRNRPTGGGRLVNGFMNWTNNSVGAIMFFNMRSALLQTISATNYMNWSDNNPAKAAAAFANQPQFWKDFAYIFNSDYLKQRRSGNQRGINESELSDAVAGSDNKAKAAISWLLKKGFLPTQIADSFAISSGGATFYRNRLNKYVKEGMSKEQAQDQAWLDFQETTEVSQQSARPDMISQQQASPLGRLILAFGNTPMQYARIMNKAARDLVNGRGDYKTHMSKIAYYGVVQSIIFGSLQSALFAALGDDDEEKYDTKKERILNGMLDSVLLGIGYGGKAISTVKNTINEYLKQKDKGFKADHAYTLLTLLGFSPPIGSKLRKVYGSIQTEKFNKGVFTKRGFTLDNPIWSAFGNVVEGITNVPLGRMSQKMLNIDNALDSNNKWWERAALLLGWNTWDLGIKDKDIEAIKEELKEEKKEASKEKAKIKKEEKKKQIEEENKAIIKENQKKSKKDGICSAVSKSGKRCKRKAINGGFCTVHEKAEERSDGKKTQCKKIKGGGKRCKMQTSNKSGLCYYHD
tara:strand:- start:46 stop:9096 length:9051 start_codon:yes stop_codon:yes gene_type:complete